MSDNIFRRMDASEKDRVFSEWIAQANATLCGAFGLSPREFKMETEGSWEPSGFEAAALKFLMRFDLEGVMYAMQAQGLEPVYIMASPATLAKYLGIVVDLGRLELAVVANMQIIGLAVVASVTLPDETVMISDRASLDRQLGRGFEARIPKVSVVRSAHQ